MFDKGVFWTIVEYTYFVLSSYYILLKDKFYGVETMDIVRFIWYNGVSVKCNSSKYHGTYCMGLDTLVGAIWC